jgi:hypothetical protein
MATRFEEPKDHFGAHPEKVSAPNAAYAGLDPERVAVASRPRGA